ncbi:MAG: hypothetical protein E7426_07915 [Ruminococcaceae bacterium]|jgi:hypothetical protein|nr:hypothetical protein [Oscillospiraceae bacterium]
MEELMVSLRENGKKLLLAAADFANTAVETVTDVTCQTVRSVYAAVRDFVQAHRRALLIAAGVLGAVAAVWAAVALLRRSRA